MYIDTAHVDPPSVSSTGTALEEPPSRSQPQADHRNLRRDEFWRGLPAYQKVSEKEFQSHLFQQKHSVTNIRQLRETLGDLVPDAFYEDLASGLQHAPMALRISPYLLSLVDWNDWENDPIRKQFIPLRSQQRPDHPMAQLDSLHEQADSPVPGLTHRYHDKALFLPLNSCPVYCRFCTRSYAIGSDTETVTDKLDLHASLSRWEQAFAYIERTPELEDVVVSGGDTFNLKPDHIQFIGERLLKIPHIRRIRYATKGLCVLPQKILTDNAWTDALTRVVDLARSLYKDVVLHTHFNHPNEITGVTQDALNLLTQRGIFVRCQTVLQRTVNDSVAAMQLLVSRLSYINVHPYYVYFHDMVPGVEDLRTTLKAGLNIEKHVRGYTAGFNTPSFVVDAPGGGGKRDAHSFEYYNRGSGIAVFTSPAVKPGRKFLYFDPVALLDDEHRWRWTQPVERRRMIDQAVEAS